MRIFQSLPLRGGVLFFSIVATALCAARADPGASMQSAGQTGNDLTLVVGTRFVGPTAIGTPANAQFTDARIPLAGFNETDHCIDQSALETATAYFNSLGHILTKAGVFYFVPEANVRDAVRMCEKMHGAPPKAWVADQTSIIAYGKVVPTAEAPALEQSLR
jgi:hypothetical protein